MFAGYTSTNLPVGFVCSSRLRQCQGHLGKTQLRYVHAVPGQSHWDTKGLSKGPPCPWAPHSVKCIIYIYHFCLLFLAFICNHLDLASSCQLCCTLLSCCCTHATPMVETWSAAYKQKSPKTSEVGSRAAGEDRNPGAAGTVPTECHSTCGGGTSCTSCSNMTWPRDPRQRVQETFLS